MMLSEWMVMRTPEGVNLNYYGAGRVQIPLTRGRTLTLNMQGDYPRRQEVQIGVSLTHPTEFVLRLRTPTWSRQTEVWLNGQRVPEVTPGTYLIVRLCQRRCRGHGLSLLAARTGNCPARRDVQPFRRID